MGLRRILTKSLSSIYRFIFSNTFFRRLLILISVISIGLFIVSLSIQKTSLMFHSYHTIDSKQQNQIKQEFKFLLNKDEKYRKNIQILTTNRQNLNISLNNTSQTHPLSLLKNITDPTKTSTQLHRQIKHDRYLRYSFVDIDHLNVNIDYLDEEYKPAKDIDMDLPSPNTHRLSRLLNIKGNISIIMYNRIPQCHEYTMQALLGNISYLHSYKYISSSIYTPFSYNQSSILSIARSLHMNKYPRLIYERHIYFFDFYLLRFATHPIWINLVRDPIYRVAAEYNRSREICRTTKRCFVQKERINETLDECVKKRLPKNCITSAQGVSRMLPFFCGLKYRYRCQDENSWTLEQAKKNIEYFYTVIGIAEEIYKFLYVLEKLLPQYFKHARLLFMNQQDPKKMADERDINIQLPNNNTIKLLKPFLKYEYAIYNYIKERFFSQYRILVDIDS